MILLTFNIIAHENSFRKNRSLNEDEILKVTVDNVSSILRILEIHNVRATFFVAVSLVENLLPLLKKIVTKGHEISLHCDSTSPPQIEEAKKIAEETIGRMIRGIRQLDSNPAVDELKKLGFSYISVIENADILFLLKRLKRTTQITEENGMSIIPEGISPYSQVPYNAFVFQFLPLKIYQQMISETLEKEDFVLVYLNSSQFTDFDRFGFKISFLKKYNSGRKLEDKLNEFLRIMNEREFPFVRVKDFVL